MPKKYRPKIKGYVLPYIYVSTATGYKPLFLVAMERLKEPGEYYCTLLGGTSKNFREIKESTVRELCEETRGYMQVETSDLLEHMILNDKDRCTIYLLPLSNSYKIIHEINSFKNGVLMPPECAESSFIIALSQNELLNWAKNTEPSSAPYYYFRKPFINKYPLSSYKKFMDYLNNEVNAVENMDDEKLDKQTHEQELIALKNDLFRVKSNSTSGSRNSSKSRSSNSSEKTSDSSSDLSDSYSDNEDKDNREDEDLSDEVFLDDIPTKKHQSLQSEVIYHNQLLNQSIKQQTKSLNNEKSLNQEKPQEYRTNIFPKVWVGERLSRVLYNLDENVLSRIHTNNSIYYFGKQVDRGICDCQIKPIKPKKEMPKMHSI